MGKYKKLLSNTAILGIGTFSSKILVYLLMRLYTACLTTEEFSSADLLTQTSNLLMPIAVCGMIEAMLRFTMDRADEDRKHVVFSTVINIMGLSTLAFLLFSPLLFFADGFFGGYTWVILVYIVTANLHNALSVYVRARGEMTLYAGQGLLNTALVIALNILFLPMLDLGVIGYVMSVVVANVIVSVFIIIKKRLWRHYSIKVLDKALAKQMLKYSIPIIPTTIFWWITAISDRFMIIGMLSEVLGESGAKSLNGLYSAAQKIPTLITLVTNIFLDAWNFSAVTESEDKQERADFFTEIFESFSSMLVIVGAIVILLSEFLTVLMVDASFYESWRFVPLLVTSTVFAGLSSFMGSVYLIEKKSSMSLVTSMAGALINIALNIVLIPMIGAMGAATATVASYLLMFILRCVNAKAYVPFKLNLATLVPNVIVIIASSVMMTLSLPYKYPVAALSVILLFIVNRKPIIRAGKALISSVKRKICK